MAISFSPTMQFNPIIPGTTQASNPSATLTSAVSSAPGVNSSASSLSSLITQLSTPTVAAALQQYKEDPRLTEMLAALMQRAQQSDAEISSQANGAYDAQRKVADQQLNRQQTRSLAANGVLPTGGLAAQYFQELSAPVYDRLNAQRAQTELDLRNARDNVKQGVTSTLAGLDNNKNQFTLSQLSAQQQAEAQRQQLLAQTQYQQASLSQQAQLASQQLAAEQARAQQQQSLAQQQLDYQRQHDSQALQFQREQALAQNQRYYSGQGSGVGGGAAGGGFGFDLGEADTKKMKDNYNNLWNGSGESTWGKSTYTGDGSAQSKYPTASQSTQSALGGAGSKAAAAGSGLTMQGFGSAPTASFYNAPASGSNFSSPSSMFYWPS